MSLSYLDLFRSGEGGYHTYRIPSLLCTPGGTLLAFCEGRRGGRGDSGEIHTLLRRSTDGGVTWDAPRVVAMDGGNTVGNPCPVVDQETDVLWLWLTHNLGADTEAAILDGTAKGTRRAWLLRSQDDGQTWSASQDRTDEVKAADWTWYATGPGVGIQLRSRRLLIPCDHAVAGTGEWRSHVLLSDDHGETWRWGTPLDVGTNECQAAELADGTVLLNMRSYLEGAGRHRRAVATSRDGGESWSAVAPNPSLIEPICQASLISLGGDDLLFANPASERRERLTVRLSEDGGRSWPYAQVLHEGPAAYCCLSLLPSGEFACLYECGDSSPYERLTLARFSPDLQGRNDSNGCDEDQNQKQ